MRGLDRVIIIAVLAYVASLLYGKWQEQTAPPPRMVAPTAPAPTPVPIQPPDSRAETEIDRQERGLADLGRGRVNLIETSARRRGQTSSGTAWSAGNDLWVSARHVVEDCERIRVAGSPWQPIAYVGRHPDADLATFRAGITRDPIALAAAVPQPGDRAFSVGFPQNQAGVAHLRLRGTERVKLAGRVASDRPFRALVWEVERYPRIRGEPERVGGLSGGPVIDRSGAAVGVAIFEAPRRHALGSVALSDVRRTLGPSRSPPQRAHIEPKEFDTQGRQLLERGTVVQVLCR